MSIAATANALQAIAQAVTGVNAAGAPTFANYTTLVNANGELKDSLLPLVMSWPERVQLIPLGNDEYETLTDWGMWFYAARDHQTNFIAGMSTAMTLAQASMTKFLDKDSYTVTDGQFILIAGPPVVYVNRTATIEQLFANQELKVTFAGIPYHGFKMPLQTKEEGTL